MEEVKDFGEMIEGKYPGLSLYEVTEIFQINAIFSEPGKARHEYGDGEKYTSVEAHMLNYIDDHPGCTVTEISGRWHKSQSSVSQIVRKLKKRGLLYSVENEDNATIRNMYLTEGGKRAVYYHKKYDRCVWERMVRQLREKYSEEELNAAFHVVEDINEHAPGIMAAVEEMMKSEATEKEPD